uniref:Secreted protein n=1 Tax=Oryzias melastigma TaxID=30732 RepID=A0A3B3DYH1_ORYME
MLRFLLSQVHFCKCCFCCRLSLVSVTIHQESKKQTENSRRADPKQSASTTHWQFILKKDPYAGKTHVPAVPIKSGVPNL